MINRKGIILAGGKGTRLMPLSNAISKQLMPVYDKPMIYYPLSTLMMSGIREFLLICNKCDLKSFKKLLGDGSEIGISISYEIQKNPGGIAEAFLIAEDFLEGSPCALILGDNLFYGDNLANQLQQANRDFKYSTIFAYGVNDPSRYGVVQFDSENHAIKIQEKPLHPESNFAVTGVYFYDNKIVEFAKTLKPSDRGELEITDINNIYLSKRLLKVNVLGRGIAWLDTGTFDSLIEAGTFIQTLEKRQGLKICCPEEIAWRMGWINDLQLVHLAKSMNSNYGEYLMNLKTIV